MSVCESPNIYTSARDLSYDFSDRWHRGRGADFSQWTPDGSRILFSHAGRIYVVEADGTELTSLSGSYEPAHVYSPTAKIDFSPTLSPDGSRVAYSTLRYAKGELYDHTYEIAVQPIDGSDRVRLTKNDRDDIAPAWSPDGSLIAFLSPGANYGNYRVFAISPDGSGERPVAPSVSAICCVLMWSPDGSRLAFIGERRETGTVEWVDTYSSDPSKYTREIKPDYVFGRQSIYTVKADGSGLVELAWSENPNSPPKTRFGMSELGAPEEGVSAFQWSPDGERIAFAARRYGDKDGIYVADPEDSSSVRRIFDLATVSEFENPLDDGFIPEKAFQREQIYEIAWSPDGSRIDFDASVVRGDAYALIVYSVSADGSGLRQIAEDRLELSERIRTGSAPKRIVRHGYNPNAAREVKGWVLSTAPWGELDETVLVKIADNRLTAVDPNQPIGAEAECEMAIPNMQRTNGLMRDCRRLLKLRDALAGDAALGWSGDIPIAEWRGVGIEDGRVRALDALPIKTVPPEIGELTSLRTLRVMHNELEGEIPPEIGNLTNLELLHIGGTPDATGKTRLAGRIPPQLGNLFRLEFLYLQNAELEGGIPPELGNMSNLKRLWLYGNRLEGEVPPELGRLSNLEELHLYANRLEGEVPPELGDIPYLEYADLTGNQLTGCVPRKLERVRRFDADIPFCE